MADLGSVKSGSMEDHGDVPLRLSAHVHHVRMDDQVIVADMRSGRYLGLDGVGARVWDLIGKGATRGAIIECLSAEYDVSTDVLERDIRGLVEDLVARRLVEPGRAIR